MRQSPLKTTIHTKKKTTNAKKIILALLLVILTPKNSMKAKSLKIPVIGNQEHNNCGPDCAVCTKSPKSDKTYCILCYKTKIVFSSSKLDDGRCSGPSPQGCLYTAFKQKKAVCRLCEIGKILSIPLDANQEPFCITSPSEYNCASGTSRMEIGGGITTECTACRRGMELNAEKKCVGLDGELRPVDGDRSCEAVKGDGCVKCRGNLMTMMLTGGCPVFKEGRRCLNERNGICLSCNVEQGFAATGLYLNNSQVCGEGNLIKCGWFSVGFGVIFGFLDFRL